MSQITGTRLAQDPGERSVIRRAGSGLKRARQLHLYLGLFFAPSIAFFAFSGALQTFRLQESAPGSTKKPPAWIDKMARIHKNQTLSAPPGRAPGRGAPGERPPQPQRERIPEAPLRQPLTTLLMKWFVVAMAAGLVTETILGVYMAFRFNRDRRLIWTLLLSGTLLPALLLVL